MPPRVPALSRGRRSCHFLLLACKSGSWMERYRSAFRAKMPLARCLEGGTDGAACQHPTGDGFPSTLTSVQKPPPKKKRETSSPNCHAK